jgi:hypothetical protein
VERAIPANLDRLGQTTRTESGKRGFCAFAALIGAELHIAAREQPIG